MPSVPSREVCFSVLHHLYLQCERKADIAVSYLEEAELSGLRQDQLQSAVTWLRSERLLRLVGSLGTVSLTAIGVATIERALASPEVGSGPFPAISSFYRLGESSAIGLCRTTLQVWLDQLDGCVGALEQRVESERTLEHTIEDLEQQLLVSKIDPQSLQLSLQELKTSL